MPPSPSSIAVNKRRGQNQYYDEVLAEGVLPLRMMQIPAGTFLMGSPDDELECYAERESPQHEVTLAQFFTAKYPVTQAQWRVVATTMPQVNRELKPNPSRFKGDLNPVEQVTWHEAVEFCDRLTLHSNSQYRLPTEAEWEYACRAGTTTPFHFGETITTDMANYLGTDETIGGTTFSGSYGNGPKGKFRKKTTLVNQFEGSNVFGLVDMHGNVWEWCQDHWHENYVDAPENGNAWIEGGDSRLRVRRGGSWVSYPSNCRSASRDWFNADDDNVAIGFRVVCSAPSTLLSLAMAGQNWQV